MRRRTIVGIAAAGTVAVLATGSAVIAGAGDDDKTDRPISGDALHKAADAALAHTGEGRVTGTEVGDEESMYEVEVTLDDGRQVDVQLNEGFVVVSSEDDDESETHDD